MRILSLTIRLHAPWVHSLKEKRMVVKSLTAKLRNKYNVSAAETDEQDIHQIIVIGVASIAANHAQADSMEGRFCILWSRIRRQSWWNT